MPDSTFTKQFFKDKYASRPYERRLAPQAISRFYELNGFTVLTIRPNPAPDNTALQAEWDLEATIVDKTGYTRIDHWEVKWDRDSAKTGNVFIEHQAFNHCRAEFVLLFADEKPYALPLYILLQLRNLAKRIVWGGDGKKSKGSLIRISELAARSLLIPLSRHA